jgi:hypothetical protein
LEVFLVVAKQEYLEGVMLIPMYLAMELQIVHGHLLLALEE